VKYLRRKGVLIGNDVKFYNPPTNVVDLTRPYMISIGGKVKITNGVKILTHGFDWCVLRECCQRPFGSAARVDIGNNVFIGVDSIILKRITINDNVVIGAGSVVSSDVLPNSVVAGNPAHIVCTIEDLYSKYLERQCKEAFEELQSILIQAKRLLLPEDFKEFFFLFLERDEDFFGGIPVRRQVGEYMEEFLNSKPEFETFNDFLAEGACVEKTKSVSN